MDRIGSNGNGFEDGHKNGECGDWVKKQEGLKMSGGRWMEGIGMDGGTVKDGVEINEWKEGDVMEWSSGWMDEIVPQWCRNGNEKMEVAWMEWRIREIHG